MICYKKCLFSTENIRIPLYEIGVRKFRKSFACRVVSSQSPAQPGDGDAGKWFTPGEVAGMTRRDLQKWCKKLGIRANTKTIQMRAELLDFHENVLMNSDILRYPFLPMQNSSSYPGPVQNAHTINNMTYGRQDKLLFHNNWSVNTSTDQGLGKVRYFKNTCSVDEGLYEDVGFCSNGLEANSITPGNHLPSVSKILQSTAPKSKLFAISHWTKKQKELLGEDVFQHKMNEIRKKGRDFHRFVHQCLADRQLNCEVPEKLQGYLVSTRKVFDKLGDAIASEKSVCHTYLRYRGKLDTLACYRGNPCIIEWKTSQRQKPSLADCGEYPMQMVAYAGAINDDPASRIHIRHGLLVIAYEDGSPADVHFLDFKQCRSFWQDWLVRLHKFKNLETVTV